MPKKIVINTGPMITLIAGLSDLKILEKYYDEVIVPQRVIKEILAKGKKRFDAQIFSENNYLKKLDNPVEISTFLKNSLDSGEASVIQIALNKNIETVCIDEAAGRRIARLNNLKLTGSLGIIISAINNGENINLEKAIRNMRSKGIWISDQLKEKALNLALNKIEGEWDNNQLSQIINELSGENIDLMVTGFDDKEIDDLINEINAEEDVEFFEGLLEESKEEAKNYDGSDENNNDHRVRPNIDLESIRPQDRTKVKEKIARDLKDKAEEEGMDTHQDKDDEKEEVIHYVNVAFSVTPEERQEINSFLRSIKSSFEEVSTQNDAFFKLIEIAKKEMGVN